MLLRWITAALLCAALLQAGCASARSAPVVDHAGQPISEEEIRAEQRPRHSAPYTIGLALAGGALGFVLGGKIGYEIDHARDTRSGCEDCGLDGLVAGVVVGTPVGMAIGAAVGGKIGSRQDREAAIQRIRDRRLREQGAREGDRPGSATPPSVRSPDAVNIPNAPPRSRRP